MHQRKRHVTSVDVSRIMFRTRCAKKDSLTKVPKMQTGYSCSKCGIIVLNLDNHIKMIHNFTRGEDEYADVFENSIACDKYTHFSSDTLLNYNPYCD